MDANNPNVQNPTNDIFSEFMTPTPPPEKKSKRVYIVLAAILVFIIVVVIIIVQITKNSQTANNPSTQITEVSQSAEKIIEVIASKNVTELTKQLTSSSPFNVPNFGIIAIENAVGSVNFATCNLVTKDSYDTEVTIVNSLSIDIVYLPYQCDTTNGSGKKTIELDMQKNVSIENSDWKLHYIMVKEVQI